MDQAKEKCLLEKVKIKAHKSLYSKILSEREV